MYEIRIPVIPGDHTIYHIFITWCNDNGYEISINYTHLLDKLDNDKRIDLFYKSSTNPSSIFIRCLSVEIFLHVKKVWNDDINEKPILKPLFDINCYDRMNFLKKSVMNLNYYQDIYRCMMNMKVDLINCMGPEYENWHMYYTPLMRRNFSFRTEEYKTLFKLKYIYD